MGRILVEDKSDGNKIGDVEAERSTIISEAMTSFETVWDYLSSCVEVEDHCFNNVLVLKEYSLTSNVC